jgi:hypothetical protein
VSTWTLLGPDRKPYASELRGTLGGHSRSRVYGRLDCPAALRAIPRGGYVIHRVFFLDEAAALAAGYRPCGMCLPGQYRAWKDRNGRQKYRSIDDAGVSVMPEDGLAPPSRGCCRVADLKNAARASEPVPEVGRCVKVAAGSGNYSGASCLTLASRPTAKKYEWMPDGRQSHCGGGVGSEAAAADDLARDL